jgi:TolB-like protein
VQRPGLAVLPVRARKQTEKQDVEADLATDVLPADLQKLSKLAKVSPMSYYAAPTWYAAA